MIKDIVDGVKEVVVEVSTGIAEPCQSIMGRINTIVDELNVKLMGSYEEIEAFEKVKKSQKSI